MIVEKLAMRKKILIVLLLVAAGVTHRLFASPAGFKDVPNGHPYKAAIEFVQDQKIVNGYPDGTFQPDKLLNRAEFTKIVVSSRFPKAAVNGCISQEKYYKRQVFADVDHKVWFEPFTCMAKAGGVIGGYSDGSFKPTNTINFAEAAKIVVKSYGLKVDAPNGESAKPWYMPFVERIKSLDAIPVSISKKGDLVTAATKTISRGEMADIIYRLRKLSDTVKDADSNFSLRIPESSLPSGVPLSKITIVRIPPDQSPIKEVSNAPMVFYRLEPTGTIFPESVRFSLEIPTVGNVVPMIFFVTGDQVEMISTPTIEIDPNTQIASVTAELAHFSGLGISGKTPLAYSLDEGPSQALEDEPFTVGFHLDWDPTANRDLLFQSGDLTVKYDDEWKIFGVTSQYSGAVISAKTDELSTEGVTEGLDNQEVDADFDRDAEDPDAILLSDMKNFFHQETFQCAVSGSEQTVRYAFNIGWGYTVTRGSEVVPVRKVFTVILKTAPFDCVSREENKNLLGDLRCAGIRSVPRQDDVMPFPVVKSDDDVNCYNASDVVEESSTESTCETDHYAPVQGSVLESLSFDRSAKKLLDPDPLSCHYGALENFTAGNVYLNPLQFQSNVRKLIEKQAVRDAVPIKTFTGTTSFDLFPEDDLVWIDNLCEDTDPLGIDETQTNVLISDHDVIIGFPGNSLAPVLKGKIARNGLLYARDPEIGKATTTFIGKASTLDGIPQVYGVLQAEGVSCRAFTMMKIGQ